MSKTSYVIITLLIVVLTFFVSRLLVSKPQVLTIGLILSVALLLTSFFSPPTGLAFLIFSMLLSPEIKLAEVPGRDVVLRIDDLLIFAVFLGWFAKSMFSKKLELVITPVLIPIFFYTLSCIVSTYFGIISNTVVLKKSFFYILKYIEYFIIYFLVTQIVRTRQQIKIYIILFIIVSIIVNLHGYSLIGKVERLYAPFDVPGGEVPGGTPITGAGEANTYGGYLLIVIALLVSLFCYSEVPTTNFLYLGLTIFSLIPLAYTKSRASYFGFVPMILTITLLTQKKKNIILGGVLLLFALAPLMFPAATETVVERVKETFVAPPYSEEEASILGLKIRELSALARVKSWKKAFFEYLPKRPILGFGVTGVGLVDTQIPLIIGELGLLGLVIFLWMIGSVFNTAYVSFKTVEDPLLKSISLCIISVLIGLIFHSVAANTFIIIRIMEPFWFLCGIAAVSKEIYERKV